jgi:hypothetical protein
VAPRRTGRSGVHLAPSVPRLSGRTPGTASSHEVADRTRRRNAGSRFGRTRPSERIMAPDAAARLTGTEPGSSSLSGAGAKGETSPDGLPGAYLLLRTRA